MKNVSSFYLFIFFSILLGSVSCLPPCKKAEKIGEVQVLSDCRDQISKRITASDHVFPQKSIPNTVNLEIFEKAPKRPYCYCEVDEFNQICGGDCKTNFDVDESSSNSKICDRKCKDLDRRSISETEKILNVSFKVLNFNKFMFSTFKKFHLDYLHPFIVEFQL